MKIFILALDGLEYNLVEEWNFRNLKQTTYGKIDLSKQYMIETSPSHSEVKEMVPYTPIVWTSFLTGLPPKKHRVRTLETYGQVLDKIRKLPLISWVKGKRRVFAKIGLKPRLWNKNNLPAPTFLDRIKPTIVLDFICYNLPHELREPFVDKARLLGTEKTSIKELEKTIWKIFKDRRQKVLLKLGLPWKIFAVYFETLDWLGHMYFSKKQKLKMSYEVFDDLARQLSSELKDTVFLIVSDHGMQMSKDGVTGTHSTHSFWSINIPTNWKPKDITDFYQKILEWAGEDDQ